MNPYRLFSEPAERMAGPEEQGRQVHDVAYWARRAQALLRVPVALDSPTVSGDMPGRAPPAAGRFSRRRRPL